MCNIFLKSYNKHEIIIRSSYNNSMLQQTNLKPTKFCRSGRIRDNLTWLFCEIATWITSILNNANILQTIKHSFLISYHVPSKKQRVITSSKNVLWILLIHTNIHCAWGKFSWLEIPLICDNSLYGTTAIYKKFILIYRNFLTIKKELKEGAKEYCTNKGVELLILTKIFIYCK